MVLQASRFASLQRQASANEEKILCSPWHDEPLAPAVSPSRAVSLPCWPLSSRSLPAWQSFPPRWLGRGWKSYAGVSTQEISEHTSRENYLKSWAYVFFPPYGNPNKIRKINTQLFTTPCSQNMTKDLHWKVFHPVFCLYTKVVFKAWHLSEMPDW